MILEIISILVGSGIVAFLYGRHKRLRKKYTYRWKKASSFKPKDVLNERPVPKHYYNREADNQIYKHINEGENVLIVGSSLSGKTRLVYQIFHKLKFYDVLVPRFVETELENLKCPVHFNFRRKKIILIDDLHRFVELNYFQHLLSSFLKSGSIILATSRSEFEYDKVKAAFLRHNLSLEAFFNNNIL